MVPDIQLGDGPPECGSEFDRRRSGSRDARRLSVCPLVDGGVDFRQGQLGGGTDLDAAACQVEADLRSGQLLRCVQCVDDHALGRKGKQVFASGSSRHLV